jgi:hypothetical protein
MTVFGKWDLQYARCYKTIRGQRTPTHVEFDLCGESQYQGVREQNIVTVQVFNDVLNVAFDIRSLVSDQFSGVVARKSRDVGNLKDLISRQAEDIKRVLVVLFDSKRPPLNCTFYDRALM